MIKNLSRIFLISIFITSCGDKNLSDIELEGRIPKMQEARNYYDQNQWRLAENAFKDVIDENPKFAQPHIDLATIYQFYLTNYINAIYHYNRYLELKPLSDNIYINEQITNLYDNLFISLSQKKKYNPKNKYLPKISNSENENINTNLTSPSVITEKKYYIVKSGDTLSKIALKFYNNSSEYEKIFKANKDLKNPGDIKPGQKIIIPK